MKLEDLKQEMPKTPEFIHQMVQEEVKKQTHTEKIVPLRNRKLFARCRIGKVAAAVAACVLATSTVAYAGVNLYHMYMEKKGKYAVETGVKAEEAQALPQKIAEVEISAGYIPEGMEWRDKYHLENKNTPYHGGFSFMTVLMDENSLDQVYTDTGVVDSEKTMFGEKEGVYLQYGDDEEFNQAMYLLFPEQRRMLVIHIGRDVTKDEAYKVAEQLTLKETDTMIDTEDMYAKSTDITPGDTSAATSVAEDALSIHKTKEAFGINDIGEDDQGKYMRTQDIAVTVDQVQVADDLSLLQGEDIPEEWRQAAGSDGKLVQNELSYIKEGDGINTLDKTVKTEKEDQKLVLVTATYTNKGDAAIHHMVYIGSLMLLEQKDGKYVSYDYEDCQEEEYDKITGSSAACMAEMGYCSVTENYGDGGNYISCLKPGESVQVKMGWIVNERDLSRMYLNLCGDGGVVCFTEDMLQAGLVDIRQ